jgi:hypothetical protein
MQTKLLLLCALIGAASTLLGQNTYQLQGKVTNAQNAALDLVAISLLRAQDSSIIKSVYSDEDGTYVFSGVAAGTYVLKAYLLGYAAYQGEKLEIAGVNTSIQVLPIQLQESIKQLQEVTVAAKTPYVERKIDRTIVNVDALLANAGSNALEALERAPGIAVDQNGLITLKGCAGVAVFIDDKPTYLSGAELENYLKSLPAGTVKQIEIMTNPPAKYEAAGNAGVINIVMKKNKVAGFHGNTNLSVQRGRYTRSNNSLNLNVNQKKISLSANLNGGFRNSFQDLNINRYYKNPDETPSSSFAQNSFIVKTGQSANAKLGLDYYLSDRTTIGLAAKGLFSPSGSNTDNKALVAAADRSLQQRVDALNLDEGKFNNGTFNAYFKRQLDSLGSSLTVDADYVVYASDRDQVFNNFIFNPSRVLLYQDRINGQLPSDISIYAAKADYVKPLGGDAKFEAGLKSAFTKTDNEAAYTNTIDGVTTLNYDLSNRFLYDEWIHAAYANYSRSIGRWGIQAGLRAETTSLTGNQLGNPERPASSFNRTYTNLFPTFYATWNADSLGNHVFTFSFGRRIDRPYFQDLNPFVSPLDKFTFYSGNPNLLPTYANNFSISHSFKGTFNTTLNYSKTLDGINETLEIVDGIYYSRPGNIATNHAFNLSVDAAIPLTSWYSLNSNAELGYLIFQSQLYTEQLNSRGTYFHLAANNSFQLGKGWSADVRGEYMSNIVYAQLLIKSWGTLNCAVQKKLLKDAASLKLSLSDLLYTRRADGIINNLRLTNADWNSTIDTRSVTLAFSYRFGKATNNRPKHNGSGSETEQQRVKNT